MKFCKKLKSMRAFIGALKDNHLEISFESSSNHCLQYSLQLKMQQL